MKQILRAIFAVVAAIACFCEYAHARCTVNAAGLTITPVTASTGTYTPPTAPTSQQVNFSVNGTYNTTNNAADLVCTVAISFNRASLPASMARISGGATMPYSVQSASGGGGNSLLFTGGGLPTATQIVTASFTAAGTNLTNRAFPSALTLTAHFLAIPGSPQGAGSYSDSLTLQVFNRRASNGNLTLLLTRGFTVSGTVNKACTIGGVATPAADSATIPITGANLVDTAAIPKSYTTVVCNVTTNLQATSLSGAVKNATSAPSGFTNMINYSVSASFSGATSSLNTATIATASGSEAGTTGSTSSSTPSGTLSVTITPQSATSKLIKGSYSDILRVTLTPQ